MVSPILLDGRRATRDFTLRFQPRFGQLNVPRDNCISWRERTMVFIVSTNPKVSATLSCNTNHHSSDVN
jgi:hypothetical protein